MFIMCITACRIYFNQYSLLSFLDVITELYLIRGQNRVLVQAEHSIRPDDIMREKTPAHRLRNQRQEKTWVTTHFNFNNSSSAKNKPVSTLFSHCLHYRGICFRPLSQSCEKSHCGMWQIVSHFRVWSTFESLCRARVSVCAEVSRLLRVYGGFPDSILKPLLEQSPNPQWPWSG